MGSSFVWIGALLAGISVAGSGLWTIYRLLDGTFDGTPIPASSGFVTTVVVGIVGGGLILLAGMVVRRRAYQRFLQTQAAGRHAKPDSTIAA